MKGRQDSIADMTVSLNIYFNRSRRTEQKSRRSRTECRRFFFHSWYRFFAALTPHVLAPPLFPPTTEKAKELARTAVCLGSGSRSVGKDKAAAHEQSRRRRLGDVLARMASNQAPFIPPRLAESSLDPLSSAASSPHRPDPLSMTLSHVHLDVPGAGAGADAGAAAAVAPAEAAATAAAAPSPSSSAPPSGGSKGGEAKKAGREESEGVDSSREVVGGGGVVVPAADGSRGHRGGVMAEVRARETGRDKKLGIPLASLPAYLFFIGPFFFRRACFVCV